MEIRKECIEKVFSEYRASISIHEKDGNASDKKAEAEYLHNMLLSGEERAGIIPGEMPARVISEDREFCFETGELNFIFILRCGR